MNIEKRYWKWNENLNVTEFKLGSNINELINKGLVKKSENEINCYEGINDYPWSVNIENEKIVSVFFRLVFFPFPDLKIWELELKNFEPTMNTLLEQTSEDYKGDKLYVAFRGLFVAVAGLIRSPVIGSM